MIATKDGLLNGFYFYFYDSGSIRGKFHYINGKQNGTFITYHENGKIKSEGKSISYSPYDLEYKYDKEGNLEETIIHIS